MLWLNGKEDHCDSIAVFINQGILIPSFAVWANPPVTKCKPSEYAASSLTVKGKPRL